MILEVGGEIDQLTSPRLHIATRQALADADRRPVVIDLSEVTFLAVAGLDVLVDAARTAQHRPEPLRIVVDHSRPVLRPLQLTGLDDALVLYRTLDEAVAGTVPPDLPAA